MTRGNGATGYYITSLGYTNFLLQLVILSADILESHLFKREVR